MNYVQENIGKTGKVWLVGAGPSDIGLITVRGKQVLEAADVIVFDKLVGQGILTLGSKEARYIAVGKKSGYHPIPQEEIDQILVREAKEGNRVVRLKGGDPFVFGRGGEEALELEAEGIPFEIIPGITSAISVPSYQGIPVTHRGMASSLHIITAHKKDGMLPDIQYDALVKSHGTLVFLMGVHTLPNICRGLLDSGMKSDMPVAILERGTTAGQRKVQGTLTDIEKIAKEQKIMSPAIILVGEVADIKQLEWYDKRSLAGKKIMVTRPREQKSKLSELLREKGAEVLELPTIPIDPIKENHALKQAAHGAGQYQWLVFTSPAGVQIFMQQLKEWSIDTRTFSGVKVAAIGPGTKRELAEYGWYPAFMPDVYDGAHLGKQLAGILEPASRVLITRARIGNPELIEELQSVPGVSVTDIPIYDTHYETFSYIDYRREFEEGITDYAIFTSASTVRGFAESAKGLEYGKVTALCIGMQTERAAKEYGMKTYVAKEPTLQALAELAENIN